MSSRAIPDWSLIDLLLLDMDGTLLDLHFDNHFWQAHVPDLYAQARGLAQAEAQAELYPKFAARRGTLEWYSIEFWSRELDLDLLSHKREHAGRIRILPGVAEFLQAARASGRRLWLLTNAHPAVMLLKLEETGLGEVFEHTFSTHEYGFPKEDARFWPRFAALHPFDPTRTLMVDDSAPVLRAARDYGIAQLVHLLHPDSSIEPQPVQDLPATARLEDLLLSLRI